MHANKTWYLNASYFELDYAELLCAGKANGRDSLPRYFTQITGLGSCMQSPKHQLEEELISGAAASATLLSGTTISHKHEGAVKTSPNSPAEELENLMELKIYATLYNNKLLPYLEMKSETDLLKCEETLLEERQSNGNIKKSWPKISIFNDLDINDDYFFKKLDNEGKTKGSPPLQHHTNSKNIQLDSFNKKTKSLMMLNATTVEKLGVMGRLIFFNNELKKAHQKYEELSYSLDREHSSEGYHTDFTIPGLRSKSRATVRMGQVSLQSQGEQHQFQQGSQHKDVVVSFGVGVGSSSSGTSSTEGDDGSGIRAGKRQSHMRPRHEMSEQIHVSNDKLTRVRIISTTKV
jgi:hypothetical protein